MFKGRSSKTSKCATNLKLVVSRIKVLRNKREIQVKHLRRDIAQLLQNKQDENARTRVDHAIREQNMVDAYGLIELYCEFICSRISSISGQKTCPPDLLEPIASLIFAAPRCADLPELLEIRSIISDKYGKHFVICIQELRSGCGVSKKMIDKLSTQPASTERKLEYMADVAREFNVNWKPVDLGASEQHETSSKQSRPANQKHTGSPKSPLPATTTPSSAQSISVRSYGAELASDASEDDAATSKPKPTKQMPQVVAPLRQAASEGIPFLHRPTEQEQPSNLETRKSDPYVLHNRNPLNPYADPYGGVSLSNPYVTAPEVGTDGAYTDVAAAAEAAALSADQAAAAARVAANLANKELSRTSSNVSYDSPRRPRTSASAHASKLEERVASYLNSQTKDEDSEWESPAVTPAALINPGRRLWSESSVAEKPREGVDMNKTVQAETPTSFSAQVKLNHNDAEDLFRNATSGSTGTVTEDLFRSLTAKASKQVEDAPVFDSAGDDGVDVLYEEEQHHQQQFSRRDSITEVGLQSMHDNFTLKFDSLYARDEDELASSRKPVVSGWKLRSEQENAREEENPTKAYEEQRWRTRKADEQWGFGAHMDSQKKSGADDAGGTTVRRHSRGVATSVRTKR